MELSLACLDQYSLPRGPWILATRENEWIFISDFVDGNAICGNAGEAIALRLGWNNVIHTRRVKD